MLMIAGQGSFWVVQFSLQKYRMYYDQYYYY